MGEILFKNLQVLQRMYELINVFCHPAIAQFLIPDISFVIDYKEMKIAQVKLLNWINQLFQLLNLICIHVYGDVLHGLTGMIMCKNVNNGVSKDSPVS